MSVLDFHAHILPGADHGSHSLKTSLVQLDAAKKHGIDRIVATPHFYPHRHNIDKFVERRAEALRLLKEHLNDKHPEIAVGAEVMLCIGLQNFLRLDELTLGGSKTLLVELPPNDFSDEYVSTVVVLKEMGYNVILAHAERYPQEYVEKFISENVMLQVNAVSIFNIATRHKTLDWIRRGCVACLGSDVHGTDKTGARAMAKIKRRLGALYDVIEKRSKALWSEFKTL